MLYIYIYTYIFRQRRLHTNGYPSRTRVGTQLDGAPCCRRQLLVESAGSHLPNAWPAHGVARKSQTRLRGPEECNPFLTIKPSLTPNPGQAREALNSRHDPPIHRAKIDLQRQSRNRWLASSLAKRSRALILCPRQHLKQLELRLY